MIRWCDENKKIHEVTGMYYVDAEKNIHALTEVNVRTLLVWVLARSSSCYGSGCWQDNLPWSETDAWKE